MRTQKYTIHVHKPTLAQTLEMLRREADGFNLALVTEIDPRLPNDFAFSVTGNEAAIVLFTKAFVTWHVKAEL